jgi:hypothetical protein
VADRGAGRPPALGRLASEDGVTQAVDCGDDLVDELTGHTELDQHRHEVAGHEIDVMVVDVEVSVRFGEVPRAALPRDQ